MVEHDKTDLLRLLHLRRRRHHLSFGLDFRLRLLGSWIDLYKDRHRLLTKLKKQKMCEQFETHGLTKSRFLFQLTRTHLPLLLAFVFILVVVTASHNAEE